MPYHSLFPRLVYLPGTSAFCNKSVCTGIRLGLFGWTVVRFVRVIRVPACARVSRVCPGSPRCLFTCIRIGLAETNLFCPVGAWLSRLMKATSLGYLHGVDEELARAAVDEETIFQVVDTHNSSLSRYSAYIILGYLGIGCAFFSWSEGWPWDDALYYCVVTMTTTGYGDLVPTSNASKLFAVTYIIFGVPQPPPPWPQPDCAAVHRYCELRL